MRDHALKPLIALLVMIAAAAPAPFLASPQDAASVEEAEPPEIEWLPWSPEVFERARAEQKGVLLSIVNAGCHACAVMDAATWSDRDVRERVAKLWLPVRVAADDRPDITTRYLAALGVLSPRQAGIPVTGFLFYTGEAMWLDVSLFAEPRAQRPGLRQLLLSMNHFWKARFAEARQNALKVQGWFEAAAKPQGRAPLTRELVGAMTDAIAKTADLQNGGFGVPPRVANPFCARAALAEAVERGDASLRESSLEALMGPVTGGTLDHLEGGFHFAPASAGWGIPTFGKRLDVTAAYLRAIADALRIDPNPRLREAADLTVGYLLRTLQAPEGGFYTRQAPSPDLNAPLDYYTFKTDALAGALGEKDMAWAKLLFGVKPEGDVLLGLPPRVTLKRPADPDGEGLPEAEVAEAEARVMAKIAAIRDQAGPPPIVKARYTDSTAQAVSALLHAGAVLGRDDAVDAALKALGEILGRFPRLEKGVPHRLDAEGSQGSPLLMQDLAYLGNAILDAYELTGTPSYLEAAKGAAKGLHDLFEDADDGGFFDVVGDDDAPGYLRFRLKPVLDSEQPSPNAEAARFLDHLTRLTGDASWARGVGRALEMAAGKLSPFGPLSASTLLAIDAHLRPPVIVKIDGSGAGARGLAAAAWSLIEPSAAVVWSGGGGKAGAEICIGEKCESVLEDPKIMAAKLAEIRASLKAERTATEAP